MKILLYLSVAIVAAGLIVMCVCHLDSKADTWISFIIGVAAGFLIVKAPTLMSYLKTSDQKMAK